MTFEDNTIRLALATANSAPSTAPIPLTGDICDNLRKANMLGYSAIEIHTRENASIDFHAISDECERLGMQISTVVTGRLHNEKGITLLDDDSLKMNTAMNGMKRYIDIAKKLNADIVVGWIKGVLPGNQKKEYYISRLAENIIELAQYALEKKVRIFIEALNRYECNFFNTGKEILDFIEKYSIPNTFIHLDTFHMNIEEEDIPEAIEFCSSKLGYIHFADSNRRYPGAGHLDFEEIIRTITDIKYRGFISVECLPQPTGEEAAELAARNIFNILHSLKQQ
ncbi:MAG: TIM barrel protein [Acetivibrionales bacterium]|jgi:sugar phosphate isomerase/epimerase